MIRTKSPQIIFLLFFLALTACSKDWTCSCSGKVSGNDYTNESDILDMKKADAEIICDEDDFVVDADTYSECSLK